jgi:hypothetical protein
MAVLVRFKPRTDRVSRETDEFDLCVRESD